MRETRVTIKIPRPLYRKLQTLIQDSSFSSVTEFIVYVLRDIASEKGIPADKDELTPEETQAIKQRLRNLGYLD
ncbi:MAG: CopG family transcriptional regulator [Candidatus Eisenbacteria sp.]|nr:CopG family transcriptional regulator [Candidatus Eisenbacteria bacterium]